MRTLLYILGVFALMGCSNINRIADGKPIRPMEPNGILKQAEKASIDWDWLGFKLDTKIDLDGASDSFTLNIRMSRDRAIWISLTPALGVEAVRVLMLPDSVKLISRVPGNKFVWEGDYDQLKQKIGVDLDFYNFQALFSGQPLGLDYSKHKFISKVDELNYVQIEKFPRKIKKLLGGIDERHLALNPQDNLAVMLNNRRANRVIERTDEDDLIVKRYWFNGITFAPVLDIYNDLATGVTIRVERSGDEEHREGLLPSKTILTATGKGVDVRVEFNIRRSRVNREYDLPFNPPADYERRESL
jgi:hypothetical protein